MLLVVSLAHPSLHFYDTLQIRMLCMLIQQHKYSKLEVSTSDANLTECGPQSGQISCRIIVVHMKLWTTWLVLQNVVLQSQ